MLAPVRSLAFLLTALLLWVTPSLGRAAAAGGGGGLGAGPSEQEPTGSRAYEKVAADKHARGARYLKKGLATEEKAMRVEDATQRDALLDRARVEYRRALRQFDSALSRQSDFHLAHSDKGFALRKLGDYPAALAAYDRALAIEPDFTPAIEYRGEAYLELGRLDDAKQAYLRLIALEMPLADMLLEKMRSFVTRRRADPRGLDPAALEAFAEWLAERARVAHAIEPDAPDAPDGLDEGATTLRW